MFDIQFLLGFVIGLISCFITLNHYYKACFKYYTDELYKQFKKAYNSKKCGGDSCHCMSTDAKSVTNNLNS